ncbi:hypothetical protein BGS_0569 [Beggiatoa sp. SS]|nr:hypothetical protein BGS_0569 [Beggiatoa sp. SS]
MAQLIYHGLNNDYPLSNSPNINSLFGLIPSSTDGLAFQKAMREE